MILTLPMAGLIKNQFPNARIYFLGNSYTKEIVLCSEFIDEFINYDELEKLDSNEKIIDDIYNSYNSNLSQNNNIYIIQFSFNDRFGIYSDLVDKFISMCKRENPDNYTESILINFYNDWLKYFYSRKGRIREFKKQVDFLCAWLRSCLLYTSPSPRDRQKSRMPSSA